MFLINLKIVFFFFSIRKALESIIRALDAQVGRPMMMTNPHCSHKEPEEVAALVLFLMTDLFSVA